MCEVDVVLDIVVDDALHPTEWGDECRKGRYDCIEIESDDKSRTDCCESIVDIVDADHRNCDRI